MCEGVHRRHEEALESEGARVETSKATIELLAKAWLAEANRLQTNAVCDCGCGNPIFVTRFKPGHDAKLLKQYRQTIKEILCGAM